MIVKIGDKALNWINCEVAHRFSSDWGGLSNNKVVTKNNPVERVNKTGLRKLKDVNSE